MSKENKITLKDGTTIKVTGEKEEESSFVKKLGTIHNKPALA